jgi:ABC-type bacteriocin/lantibiotic exporter with double-glycine peptidase domain
VDGRAADLVTMTRAENIWYGQAGPVDIDLVRRVSMGAHVDEFVCELPEGYQTVVGERGLKLSGGQRQAGTAGTYRRLWEHQSGGFLSS